MTIEQDRKEMDKIRIGVMHHNLNQIVQFHNHVHGFFNVNLSLSQIDEKLSPSDKKILKLEYEEHLPNQLRKSVFLMIFGHLEEHLFLSWCDHGRNAQEKDERTDGVKKYKNLFVNLNIVLLRDSDYQLIVDAYKIRNTLIHAAGRVDIIKKQGEIERIVQKYKTYFTIQNKRVEITNEGILYFNRSVKQFTEKVTRAARSKSR